MFQNLLSYKLILKSLALYFSKFVKLLGWLFIVAVILSFTDIPFYAYYWLGTHGADLEKKPHYIVLLGGVGMPSPEDLIRTYTTAGAWQQVPDSKIIIAFPPDTAYKQYSHELQMARELIMRGVDSSVIFFEPKGISTHTQAENIAQMMHSSSLDTISVRIVTSPEHMFRAVKTFKKNGFVHVGGTAAFENAIDENKLINGRRKEGEKKLLNIRYNMWSYLKYEITVTREIFAIFYYKIRGWM
ncbi:MAG: YdcF family protein [Bacteroidales bacterium]|nr:YdcF family protein [Bacteroidales bacterium]MBN2821520.1 YdcF family protein [Bacteroidales bacterium]